MKKFLILPAAIILSFASVAYAAPDPKVFVCKYIGTPGVDERLQTGQNPINVSSNSIKNYAGVGSFFNDAQGRSYVLAIDTGQQEPKSSACPIPTVSFPNPPAPTPTPTPPVTPPTPTPPVTTVNETPQVCVAVTETPAIDFTGFTGK